MQAPDSRPKFDVRNLALASGLLASLLLGGCSSEGPATPSDAEPELDPIAAAMADPARPENDRDRDADRKPTEILDFCSIEPGWRVAELMATRGYYAELLVAAVGPAGKVYAQNNAFVRRFSEEDLDERVGRLGGLGLVRHDAELEDLRLPDGLDAAMLVRFYHDLYWLPAPEGNVDRAAFNRQVFDALRPGGIFCVIDHHAESGSGARDASGERGGLHRVDASLVREEILAAGFAFDAESDLLSHPEDTRDWNIFADDAAGRDRTDRFVYRFRKP